MNFDHLDLIKSSSNDFTPKLITYVELFISEKVKSEF